MLSAGGYSGGPTQRAGRDRVDFIVPDEPTLRAMHVDQRTLDNVLSVYGALGFVVGNGLCSSQVEDLPEGGAVHLVLPGKPRLATQVCL